MSLQFQPHQFRHARPVAYSNSKAAPNPGCANGESCWVPRGACRFPQPVSTAGKVRHRFGDSIRSTGVRACEPFPDQELVYVVGAPKSGGGWWWRRGRGLLEVDELTQLDRGQLIRSPGARARRVVPRAVYVAEVARDGNGRCFPLRAPVIVEALEVKRARYGIGVEAGAGAVGRSMDDYPDDNRPLRPRAQCFRAPPEREHIVEIGAQLA